MSEVGRSNICPNAVSLFFIDCCLLAALFCAFSVSCLFLRSLRLLSIILAIMTQLNEKEMGSLDEQDGEQKNKRNTGVESEVSYDLAVSKDGVRLHPQPTPDPRDPLNWSTVRKNTVLGIVMFKYANHFCGLQRSSQTYEIG